MNYTIDPSTFALYLEFPVSRTYGTAVEILLYGILLVLLGIAAQLLYRRTGPGRWILGVVTSVMAALATLQLVIHVYTAALAFQIFELAVQGDFNSATASSANRRFNILYLVQDLLLVTNNLVTDGLFIWRCFVVWGRNLRIVVVPILMLLSITVLGYIYAYEEDYLDSTRFNSRIAYLMSVFTNVLLMMLTAGRIWWIRRAASVLSESSWVRRYNTVIAIILESGAFYCLSVVIYVAAGSVPSPNRNLLPVTVIFRAALPMIVNIAPTLIIVRVEQGTSFGEGGTAQQHERQIDLRERRVGQPRPLGAPAPIHPFVIDIHAGDSTPEISVADIAKRV
ncbi:hypothetical protein C8R43DRAFT_1038363 [Mycena crocata]|nr:hypothetical protein C8R43DRAFT_1038363 [Mycena crocata]